MKERKKKNRSPVPSTLLPHLLDNPALGCYLGAYYLPRARREQSNNNLPSNPLNLHTSSGRTRSPDSVDFFFHEYEQRAPRTKIIKSGTRSESRRGTEQGVSGGNRISDEDETKIEAGSGTGIEVQSITDRSLNQNRNRLDMTALFCLCPREHSLLVLNTVTASVTTSKTVPA
ncbi:hypothetical protein EVAR_103216_1 [Eumeta japonica]|uniref:Uncharacterized protein n=1 Tax=Eumeta variegata TaxID=151549 RepID=A0A4C1ZXE7_EUMVA|nr:hypothetical protein EVAR_103216_1 [Eumeta japonica]